MMCTNAMAQEIGDGMLIPISDEEYDRAVADMENGDFDTTALMSGSLQKEPLGGLEEEESLSVTEQVIESENPISGDNKIGIEKISGAEEEVQSGTPIANLKPVILNEDSLRDGMITTETMIRWDYDHYDVDGDITDTFYEGSLKDML